jgi:flagellar motility protein MotE (MotC chaperone)
MNAVAQQHGELAAQRRNNAAWRLLVADNAPLILGFLDRVFLTPNVRQLPGPELVDALDDHLWALRAAEAEAYPKDAEAYLGDWVEKRWLRRWYPANTDVPHYAPTSAVETAAAFARSLSRREFLGTASRLLTVRDLLRQITAGAATDPDVRLAALQRQRAEIDEQIDALRSGTAGGLDETAIRERYAQAVATARELLGDLREVEENFRDLDREVRRQATTWSGPRGEFLKLVFGTTAEIGASDQGRSWSAFWEHMTSQRQREELDELLAAVSNVPALADAGDQVGQLLREELFGAAGDTQRTVASLSAQLRRFLDERSWTETRRIHEAVKSALAAAMRVGDGELREAGSELPGMGADLALPLERPLYTPRVHARLDSSLAEPNDDEPLEALVDLFDISHIDLAALRDAVAATVVSHGGHATLAQVVEARPLTEGLAELIGYLQVADDGAALLSDRREQVAWIDAEGRRRQADVPLVLFGDSAHLTPVPAAAATNQRGR